MRYFRKALRYIMIYRDSTLTGLYTVFYFKKGKHYFIVSFLMEGEDNEP